MGLTVLDVEIANAAKPEVAKSLEFLIDSANHQRDSLVIEGRTRAFYVLPFPDHHIWGATAGMLVNLYRYLAHTPAAR